MWCACHSRDFALSKFIFMSNLRKTKDKFPREHDMTYYEKNKLSLATLKGVIGVLTNRPHVRGSKNV